MITPEKIVLFQNNILSWYESNKRQGLPRRDSFDQYKVLVSEIMLQQTQVDRVIPKFNRFMEHVPSMQDLAVLEKPLLLSLWSGLGFNSRALRLQQCAQLIIQNHDGILPNDRNILRSLPGIGVYTSASLLAFVYDMQAPVVDTNIRRVFISELGISEKTPQKGLEAIAMMVTPPSSANDRNNALMDYGAIEATVAKTGIKSTSKQSKFAGSTRQIRGNIVKHIVKHGPSQRSLLKKLFPHEKFDSIVAKMIQDSVVVEYDGVLSF